MKKSNDRDAMNPDEFEQDLQRRSIRPLPPEWRADILRAANAAAANTHHASTTAPSLLSSINHHLSSLLWPSPLAWAGLAAVWMMTAGFIYVSSGDGDTTKVEVKANSPSTELKMALREQRRTLAQLLESPESPAVEPPKSFISRPRGEIKLETVIV